MSCEMTYLYLFCAHMYWDVFGYLFCYVTVLCMKAHSNFNGYRYEMQWQKILVGIIV